MNKAKPTVTTSTVQKVKSIMNPKAFNKEGLLIFIPTSSEKKLNATGDKYYYRVTYDFKFYKDEKLIVINKSMNSVVDLKEMIGLQVIAKVKITERFDKFKKKLFENYFVIEAKLTKNQNHQKDTLTKETL